MSYCNSLAYFFSLADREVLAPVRHPTGVTHHNIRESPGKSRHEEASQQSIFDAKLLCYRESRPMLESDLTSLALENPKPKDTIYSSSSSSSSSASATV